MAQDTGRRAVIPGAEILGPRGAALAQMASLGGAVVPGPEILGDLGAAAERVKLDAARALADKLADPKAQKGPTAKDTRAPAVVAKPAAAATEPKAPGARKTKPAPVKVPAGYSEQEVVDILAVDPNDWERVLTLENQRPEFRVTVAQALLAAAAKATEKPMPDSAIAALQVLLDADLGDPAGVELGAEDEGAAEPPA